MNLISKIINCKRIVIIGRGPSARYLKANKNDLLIGINLKGVLDFSFDCYFSNGNIINLKNKEKPINTKIYKEVLLGSVPFSLINLIKYFNNIFENKKKKNIILYGFDFYKSTQDEDILKRKRLSHDIQELIDVNTQLYAYETFKKDFNNLNIFKFGFDFHSDFKVKNVENKNDVEIISELTTNHQGDTDRLIKLIESSITANCKVIKFQKRDVSSFYPKKKLDSKYITPISNNFKEYRDKLELTNEQLDLIKFYQQKNDLKIIFSALDYSSYDTLKKLGFKYFKIPSTISNFDKFINFIAKVNLPEIYISTGMTTHNYVKNIVKKFNHKKKINLMHAISCYPTKFIDINFGIISYYRDLSLKNKNIIPGYSSHDVGSLGCMLAITAGAKIIEKHVKIGVTDWMHFDDTAIDAKIELPKFMREINKVYSAIGSGEKEVYKCEHHKY